MNDKQKELFNSVTDAMFARLNIPKIGSDSGVNIKHIFQIAVLQEYMNISQMVLSLLEWKDIVEILRTLADSVELVSKDEGDKK